MKRIFAVIAVLACAFAVFAVDTSSLTAAQQKAYYSQALSIQEKTEETSGSSIWGDEWALFALTTSLTTKDWDPYQGSTKITKEQFFTLTGEEALLAEAQAISQRNAKRQAWGWGLTIGGTVGYIVGTALVIGADETEPSGESLVTAGVIAMGISSIPLAIGIIDLCIVERQDVSASFAMGIADIYNQELMARIKVSF